MKKVKIYMVLLLVAFVFMVSADVPDMERSALVALYNSTDGDNWTDNRNWMSGDPCANEWYGVYCSEESITFLELFENNLTGQIPTEINQLSNLSFLDLSTNSLTGQIPTEVFELSELEYLYLNANNLSGTIPVQIGNLTNLSELSLGFNNFSGSIPKQIGDLLNLTRLSLTHANLTGEIPEEIGNLTQLFGLYLFENHLTGEIPNSIGNLTQLRSLQLFNNQLSGEIPSEIENLTLLNTLAISGNALSGEIPESILNLQNLYGFYFEFNALYASNSAVYNYLSAVDCYFFGFEMECPSLDSQTEAPRNFHVASEDGDSMTLAWDAVSYQQAGGYQLWMSESEEGPYRLIHETENKQETMYEVTSLTAGVDYYFQIKSYTSPHEYNKNLVYSVAKNIQGETSNQIQYPMNTGHSGSWYNPEQDGHGLAIEILANNRAAVYWYVFDNEGNPMWLLGLGEHNGVNMTVNMSVSSGGLFPPHFNSDDVDSQFWGTLTLEFTGQGSLKSSWVPVKSSDFEVGELNMEQFTRVASSDSDNSSNDFSQIQPIHSGSWFDPMQSGHGLALQILPNNIGALYWYAFDNEGNQVWIAGSGLYDGTDLVVELNTFSGALFPPEFNSDDAVRTYWGTATLSFDDCNNGQFSWNPEGESTEYTAGEMPVTRLTALSGLSCGE